MRRGPHTGRDLDCVVTTGDNTDNHEHVELDWFLALMNGGEITANTGADEIWEGVQTGGSTHYWHPGGEVEDGDAGAGFPQLPELLAGAMSTHVSPGLEIPWFSVFGNHDDSINGTLPTDWDVLRELEPGVGELRHAGWDVENLLCRFPNVLAWVNGHTHTNTIELHEHDVAERRYWKITTASHVDFPQQARVLEVVDNRDGTLSLLSTLIEAKAPYQGEGLASLYRELSFNDLHAERAQEGEGKDRNVELLLAAPGH